VVHLEHVTTEGRADRLRSLDRRVVESCKGIRVLGSLSWAPDAIERFLAAHRQGRRDLPDVRNVPLDHGKARRELADLKAQIDSNDPAGRYLDETAGSYALAARMLEVPGTAEFAELSAALYGRPDDRLPGSSRTHLEAADDLLAQTRDLADVGLGGEPELVHSAEVAREMFQHKLDAFFGEGAVEVEIDPDLASKAAAGSKRLRIRGRTGFSARDVEQLVQHEAFVHTATALNGRSQPILSAMSLGAPRTTLTQEGLATVAELVTRTIDVGRLRRIALRIRAIHMALDGADFLDVFQYFLEAGQSEDESVRSAMRVFRGGDLRGRHVFTKDVVYLQGMVAVHTFLRKALFAKRPELIAWAFAGRIHLADVFLLEEELSEGLVVGPRYRPAWATDLPALGAYLAFARIAYAIDEHGVPLEEILPLQDF
jgi:uncharacterized protein (TIGR02421 family)